MRVVRAFAFLDLCGFTAFTQRRGDAAAVELLTQLRATLRGQAEQDGVRVTKWLGDGAMLSGVDPTAVLTCVRATFTAVAGTSELPMRAGVAHGPAIMFEGDDYIGVIVNAAARLCDAAPAGTIYVTEEAMWAAGLSPVDEETRAISLPGSPAPLRISELRAARNRTAQPDKLVGEVDADVLAPAGTRRLSPAPGPFAYRPRAGSM